MPTVPRTPERSVKEAPLPTVRRNTAGVTADTFGGGDAAAIDAQNQKFLQAGAKIIRANQIAAKKVRAQEADNQAGLLESDIQTGVAGMRGRDSFGAADFMNESWEEGTQKILEDIQDNEIKGLVQAKFNARYASLYKSTQSHMANQAELYDKETTDGSVNVAQDQAAKNYNNPEAVERSIFIMTNARLEWGDRNGLTIKDPQLQDQITNDISRTVEQVYRRSHLEGTPEDAENAEALAKSLDSKITAEDRKAMEEVKTKGVKKRQQIAEDQFKTSIVNNGIALADKVLKGEFGDTAEIKRMRVLAEMGSPLGIDSTIASVLNQFINDPTDEANPLMRKKLMFGIPETYFNIDMDKDGEVDKDVRYSQIALFYKAAFEAFQNEAITEPELKEKIKNVKQAFNDGIQNIATDKHKNGQAVWKFTKGWFAQHMSGISVVENGVTIKQPISPEEAEEALAFVGGRLMAFMRDNDVKAVDIQPLTEALLGEYILRKFPQVAAQTSLPNAIANSQTSFRKLYSGESKAKPDATIGNAAPPPAYDPTTQELYRNKKTGAYEVRPK